MRTIVALLLLTTAAPAFAQDPGPEPRWERRESARQDRDDRRDAEPSVSGRRIARLASDEDQGRPLQRLRRGSAESRGEVAAARDFAPESPRAEHFGAGLAPRLERGERPASRGSSPQADRARLDEADAPAPGPRIVQAPGTRRRTGDSVADWRLRERAGGGTPELVQEREDSTTPEALREPRQRLLDRIVRSGDPIGRPSPVAGRVPREGTQPPLPVAQRPANQVANHWRGDWRRDRRYDWHRWRDRHRDRFHLGFYFDPFGWSYRRHYIGWRLWPSYYHRSYWLHDPYYYRLPYAPPGYRWIRYWDDALLVDTWDGRVVDVIHNFFW